MKGFPNRSIGGNPFFNFEETGDLHATGTGKEKDKEKAGFEKKAADANDLV